ncbi:MAG TPA: hypothetical protein VI320_34470 [Terracidiphilus sp.]
MFERAFGIALQASVNFPNPDSERNTLSGVERVQRSRLEPAKAGTRKQNSRELTKLWQLAISPHP